MAVLSDINVELESYGNSSDLITIKFKTNNGIESSFYLDDENAFDEDSIDYSGHDRQELLNEINLWITNNRSGCISSEVLNSLFNGDKFTKVSPIFNESYNGYEVYKYQNSEGKLAVLRLVAETKEVRLDQSPIHFNNENELQNWLEFNGFRIANVLREIAQ